MAWSFMREGLVDLLHVYIAPVALGDAEAPSLFTGASATSVEHILRMRLQEVTVLGGGVLLTFRPEAGTGAHPRYENSGEEDHGG